MELIEKGKDITLKTEYGVKIKSFEAKSLYEYNLGINFKYDYNYAVLTNSLLLDFLKNNGLKIEHGETKDIICIKFNHDSRDYKSEKAHWEYLIEHKHSKKNSTKIYSNETIEYFKKRLADTISKKDLFQAKKKGDIRIDFYNNGVDIKYITRKKNGEIKNEKTIHYNMLYRSTGKAKAGECMFICDKLFKKTQNFIRMGYKLPKENAPLVEIGAYSSLVASTIVGKIQINPKNILILKDYNSFFKTNVISIETDNEKHCHAIYKNDYELKNTMFDGQGLIDESIFPTWCEGYVLLRHHMTKMACFKTKIQKFFKDHYGDNYDNAIIKDMWGNEHYAKDIVLITTDNAIKWKKFGITYDEWCTKVNENNNMFGIVKTAHKSKLGNVQKMSYQMINSLDIDKMPQIVETTLDYIYKLKSDNDIFLDYLDRNSNYSNGYSVLSALCKYNNEFFRNEWFRERRWDIIKDYTKAIRNGKLIQNADNLVFCGSPYAMLMYSVGLNPETDPTFNQENDAIQCFTTRFNDGEYLAGFRSPHNSRNNILHLHNIYSKEFFEYFDLGNQIIALNVCHTDVQDRANGCDFDSDAGFITNSQPIIESAKNAYLNNSTIVNNIPMDGKKYDNTLTNFAIIDNGLAQAQEAIGSSSNVAQIAQTYMYSFPNEQKYIDYVCILAVIAQCAIDNAKRTFDIDINSEISRISKDMKIKTNGYPIWWKSIQDKKRAKDGSSPFDYGKINKSLICPMNYLYEMKIPTYRNKETTLPMSYYFTKYPLEISGRRSKKVEDLITKYMFYLRDYKIGLNWKNEDSRILNEIEYDELLEDLKKVYISNTYIGLTSYLIDRAFCITPQTKGATVREYRKLNSLTDNNKTLLLKILYDINPNNVIKCFNKNLKNE